MSFMYRIENRFRKNDVVAVEWSCNKSPDADVYLALPFGYEHTFLTAEEAIEVAEALRSVAEARLAVRNRTKEERIRDVLRHPILTDKERVSEITKILNEEDAEAPTSSSTTEPCPHHPEGCIADPREGQDFDWRSSPSGSRGASDGG